MQRWLILLIGAVAVLALTYLGSVGLSLWRRREPLGDFTPISHQERVFASDSHVSVPFDLFFDRWRCGTLRWSTRGVIERQLERWGNAQFPNKSAFEAAWLRCNLWSGHLLRAQIVRGALYLVEPPPWVQRACPQYTFDKLRARALAAIIARTARYTPLPNVDLLLNLYDDPALPQETEAAAPVFAFNRLSRGRSSMLLLPLIAEPAFPFLDSEILARHSMDGDRNVR